MLWPQSTGLAGLTAHPLPRGPDGAVLLRSHHLTERPVTAQEAEASYSACTVPVEGKSPSAHGEFSTAQRLMEPMSKSPCPFLVPQVGLHPIPLGQLVLRLGKVCGAQEGPQVVVRTAPAFPGQRALNWAPPPTWLRMMLVREKVVVM